MVIEVLEDTLLLGEPLTLADTDRDCVIETEFESVPDTEKVKELVIVLDGDAVRDTDTVAEEEMLGCEEPPAQVLGMSQREQAPPAPLQNTAPNIVEA